MSPTPTEIADDGLLITADGYEQLRAELDWLRDEGRRELAERLRDARLDGDVADNPALLDVLEEHAQLERRIAVLEDQLAQVRVVTPTRDGVAGLTPEPSRRAGGRVLRERMAARCGAPRVRDSAAVGPIPSRPVRRSRRM